MAEIDAFHWSSDADGFSACDYAAERNGKEILAPILFAVRNSFNDASDATLNITEFDSGLRNDTLTGSSGNSLIKLVISKFYQGFE